VELLGLRTDLRPFDVVFRQVAMKLRVAQVSVIPPPGREQEIHDVQPEPEISRPCLLVEEALRRDAADISLLADARLQGVRLDPDFVRGLPDLDRRRGIRYCTESKERPQHQRKPHGNPPFQTARSVAISLPAGGTI